MPSIKNPKNFINIGSGRIPANSVDVSSLNFPISGATDLQNHINDTLDAHMAGAIGVPPTNPSTGQPLLSSAGGPFDGESVLDALSILKDLLPVRPDRLGFDGSVPNSGVPNWGPLSTSTVKGAWTDPVSNKMFLTKYLYDTPGVYSVSGVIYPSDRGVLALYRANSIEVSAPTDFTTGTLLAYLHLGNGTVGDLTVTADYDLTKPEARIVRTGTSATTNNTTVLTDLTGDFTGTDPVTVDDTVWIPSGGAQGSYRVVSAPTGTTLTLDRTLPTTTGITYYVWRGQPNYEASGVGYDLISLKNRLPYDTAYAILGNPYTPFNSKFTAYQIGTYTIPLSLSSTDQETYLLVHWKESLATTLASISPANFGTNFTSTNVYSAHTSDGDTFYGTLERRNVYVDTNTTVITGDPFLSSPAGDDTTVSKLSGIIHYRSTGLQLNILATAQNLVKGSYYTHSVSGGSIPAGYESPTSPVKVDMSSFGGSVTPYSLLNNANVLEDVGGTQFTITSPPAALPASTAVRFQRGDHPIGGTAIPTLDGLTNTSTGRAKIIWSAPFTPDVVVHDSRFYVYLPSSFPAYSSGFVEKHPATDTLDTFVDEQYRFNSSFSITSGVGVTPTGISQVFDSTVTLPSGELQVLLGKLIYPQHNFLLSTIRPLQTEDYSALTGIRRYVRAFDRGALSVSGTLRIKGLPGLTAANQLANFRVLNDNSVVNETTDHPGGMTVQVRPGPGSIWYDVGRTAGSGSGGDIGALTNPAAVTIDNSTGELVIPFTMGSSTELVSGKYPLFVRISIQEAFKTTLSVSALRLT